MALSSNDFTVNLSLSEAICGIILLWITYYVGYAVYSLYFHPLSKFPGPKLTAISLLPYFYWEFRGKLHVQVKRLHDQYGNVVRIRPDTLVYRAPQAWKDIYGHRKSGDEPFLKDQKFYLPAVNGFPTIINANEADHSRIRRLLAHAFSDRALREQEPLLRSYVDLLIDRLTAQVAGPSRGVVDMIKWYNYTTFDIIGDLSFGEPFNCLKDGQYHPWVTVFQSVKAQLLFRVMRDYPILAPLLRTMAASKGLIQKRIEHFNLGVERLNRRLQRQTDRPDFMSYILRHNDEKGMTKPEIEATVATLILAGSETTATLLCGCTFYLLKNPAVYRRLVDEIRGAFKDEKDIDLASLTKLPYLHAVLEESLRIYPPVPAMIPRRVPDSGAIIDNQFVPGGTSVSMFQFSAFHAESNFAEPESFIPERWLDDNKNNSSDRFASDCKEALQPFSYGPRNCLGKNLAYAEMRLILAKVLWHFDLALQPESADWTNQKVYILWEKHPLTVKLTPVVRR
ncbi:benzoate 4-monooxygenase cytochrome P450 [Thermoascus aurantiacus ATCC 26904]